jgi:hypothetical protein
MTKIVAVFAQAAVINATISIVLPVVTGIMVAAIPVNQVSALKMVRVVLVFVVRTSMGKLTSELVSSILAAHTNVKHAQMQNSLSTVLNVQILLISSQQSQLHKKISKFA